MKSKYINTFCRFISVLWKNVSYKNYIVYKRGIILMYNINFLVNELKNIQKSNFFFLNSIYFFNQYRLQFFIKKPTKSLTIKNYYFRRYFNFIFKKFIV